jgi:WhiB family redox-sensing transcriptional regulator
MTVYRHWRHLAACRDQVTADDDPFFAGTKDGDRRALAICARCPVQAACLTYAVRTGQRYGVWGGQREQEVRRLVALDRQGQSRISALSGRANAGKARCKHGHPFNQANTYYTRDGKRRCRTCLRDAFTAWVTRGGRRA